MSQRLRAGRARRRRRSNFTLRIPLAAGQVLDMRWDNSNEMRATYSNGPRCQRCGRSCVAVETPGHPGEPIWGRQGEIIGRAEFVWGCDCLPDISG